MRKGRTTVDILPFSDEYEKRREMLGEPERQAIIAKIGDNENFDTEQRRFGIYLTAKALIEESKWYEKGVAEFAKELSKIRYNQTDEVNAAVVWIIAEKYADRPAFWMQDERVLRGFILGGEPAFSAIPFSRSEFARMLDWLKDQSNPVVQHFFTLLQGWGLVNPELAAQHFIDGLSPDPPITAQLMKGISEKKDLQIKMLPVIEGWLDGSYSEKIVALGQIGGLYRSGILNEQYVVRVADKFLNEENDLAFHAADAIGECWEYKNDLEGQEIESKFKQLLKSPNPSISYAVSFRLDRKGGPQEYIVEYLNSNINLDSKHKGIVEHIVPMLGKLILTDPEYVAQFIYNWVKNHADCEPEQFFEKDFQSIFWNGADPNHRVWSEVFLSFSLGDSLQARLAAALANTVSLRTLPSLGHLGDEQFGLLINRLLAYFLNETRAHRLIMQAARWASSQNRQQIIVDAMTELMERYPGHTKEFLDSYVCLSPIPEKIISEMYRRYDNFVFRDYDWKIPFELDAPIHRERTYQRYAEQRQRKVAKDVEQSGKFPLQQLLPKRSINRGTTIMYTQEGRNELVKSRMASFKYSGEYPRSPVIDPESETWKQLVRMSGASLCDK